MNYNRYYKKHYNISEDDYRLMHVKQGGRCAICRLENESKRRLAVDHDHRTGKVRGLLCSSCNMGIGLLKEHPLMFLRVVKYLGWDGHLNQDISVLQRLYEWRQSQGVPDHHNVGDIITRLLNA